MNDPSVFPNNSSVRSLLLLLLMILIIASSSMEAAGSPSLAPAPGPSRRPISVGMFLRRGVTDSEKGFMETLRASPDFEPTFTVLDGLKKGEGLTEQVRAAKNGHFDLIYGFGTSTALALKESIRDTPVVFNIVSRPVENGIISSWSSSGNNLTGVSNWVAMESAFRALRLMVPFRKMAFIYSPGEANSRIQLQEMLEQQQRFGFRVVPCPLARDEDLVPSLKNLILSGVDAVLLPSDTAVFLHAKAIMDLLNKYKIPTMATVPELVRTQGVFMVLGPDYRDLGRLAGENALAVLRGRPPSEVASRIGERLSLAVNLTTAKRLGLTLPVQMIKTAELVR